MVLLLLILVFILRILFGVGLDFHVGAFLLEALSPPALLPEVAERRMPSGGGVELGFLHMQHHRISQAMFTYKTGAQDMP